jgi:hypothetical protein
MMERALWTFKGVRMAVDMNWLLDAETPVDRLCHWEATLNPLLGGDIEARMICDYRLDTLPEAPIVAGLRTHPVVTLDGDSRANPFYDAPRILENEPHLNLPGPETPRLDEMLAGIAVSSRLTDER